MELADLILTAFNMLLGEEGKDYCLPETDPDWWAIRLWISRN